MDFDFSPLLSDPTAWAALISLVVMEIVLGIDNLIFISILTNKLPEDIRERARSIGIGLALVFRLALLATIAVIVNKKFWDGLPPDIRATLQGAMKDATKYANDIAKKENDDALEEVRKSGKTQILTLTPQQKAAMKKALVPVHKENESRVGKDTLAEVYRATGFKP